MKDAHLVQVGVTPVTFVITDLQLADAVFNLAAGAQRAADGFALTRAEVEAWTRSLQDAARAERFFAALTGFIAVGQRPGEFG